MPHKHKRDKSKNDASFYDLPPSKTAHPLPVTKLTSTIAKPNTKTAKRKHAQIQDDTPRAFTRLLGNYRPPRSGLDDGVKPSKKKARKLSKHEPNSNPATLVPAPLAVPSIQPREPLSAFAARVDAALPFSGLSKRSGAAKETERGRQTKTERKMQKMQKEWREEDQRMKEKLEEASDEDVDESTSTGIGSKRTSSKKKRRRENNSGGRPDDDDDDPWAHIAAKRLEEQQATKVSGSGVGLVGLHDVVLAPPRFSRVPKRKESQAVGGLKRQEELSEARMTVVEGYRQMMRQKRGQGG